MATAFNTIIANDNTNIVQAARAKGKVIAFPRKAPELEDDADKLRKIMVNAYRMGEVEYAERAKRRVWELHKVGNTDLDQRFGEIIAAYETFLSDRNDRTTRATRTWQKVRNKGVKQAIIEWVTSKQERQGFIDLVEAGYGQFTIEALVVSMADEFDDFVRIAAYKRLRSAGVKVGTIH
jgi:hypothetical protein